MVKQNLNKKILDYGHEYVVEQDSLSSNKNINFNAQLINKKYVFALFFFAVMTFFLFSDAFMQVYRQEFISSVKRDLQIQRISELMSQNNSFNIKSNAKTQLNSWEDIPENIHFFSQNSFYIPQLSVFIYANPTNLSGRFFSPVAKEFHVAIIFKNSFDFELPDNLNLMGIQNVNLKYYDNKSYILLEMDIPAEHWLWFGRVFTRTIFQASELLEKQKV